MAMVWRMQCGLTRFFCKRWHLNLGLEHVAFDQWFRALVVVTGSPILRIRSFPVVEYFVHQGENTKWSVKNRSVDSIGW